MQSKQDYSKMLLDVFNNDDKPNGYDGEPKTALREVYRENDPRTHYETIKEN